VHQQGYLTEQDFMRLMHEHKVYVSDSELKSLLNRYDADGSGRVSYSEFVQELTPKNAIKTKF
jgi:Ca2+-binding EF-hand superfamily protein